MAITTDAELHVAFSAGWFACSRYSRLLRAQTATRCESKLSRGTIGQFLSGTVSWLYKTDTGRLAPNPILPMVNEGLKRAGRFDGRKDEIAKAREEDTLADRVQFLAWMDNEVVADLKDLALDEDRLAWTVLEDAAVEI